MNWLKKIFAVDYQKFTSLSGEVFLYSNSLLINPIGTNNRTQLLDLNNILDVEWKDPKPLFNGYIEISAKSMVLHEPVEILIVFSIPQADSIKLLFEELKTHIPKSSTDQLPLDIL